MFFLPLLVLLPCAVLGTPIDPPSEFVARDYPSALARRDLIQTFSDYVSNLADGVSKDDIIQGILPDFFQNLPGADDIKSQLGLNDTGVDSLPLEVLNIPFVPLLSLFRSSGIVTNTPPPPFFPQWLRKLHLPGLEPTHPRTGLQAASLEPEHRLQQDHRPGREQVSPRSRHQRAAAARTGQRKESDKCDLKPAAGGCAAGLLTSCSGGPGR